MGAPDRTTGDRPRRLLALVRGWPRPARLAVLGGTILLGIVVAALLPPIPQDPAYHLFADQRPFLGVPNFADEVSNLPFLLVAAVGVLQLRRLATGDPAGEARLPYLTFYAAVGLTGLGSAWYHLDPTTPTLFWDRIGISLIAAGLTAIFVADRIGERLGVRVVLPVLLVMAVSSVDQWRASELAGAGDLRFYALVQFLPGLLIPLICLLFPGHLTRGRYVAYFLLWYGLAKLFELLDHQIFDLLAHTVSGHTLKHLAAAAACAMVPLMLRATQGSAARSLAGDGRATTNGSARPARGCPAPGTRPGGD